MPLVNVQVNGRAYTVACDEGEEEHLRELSIDIDKRVRDVAATVGQAGDARLLLMAALLLTDELADAQAKLNENEKEISALKAAKVQTLETYKKQEDQAAHTIENAASRIEAIAARLARA